MNNGSRHDYRSGTKETWRNTIWNLIGEHGDRLKPVLYLAGPQDNDRINGLKHGWPAEMLIGIDADSANVRRVKARFGLGLDARIEDVCRAWPDAWNVGAVIADFCGGLTEAAQRLVDSMRKPAFFGTIVVVNLLRGRDPLSEDFRVFCKSNIRQHIESLQADIADIRSDLTIYRDKIPPHVKIDMEKDLASKNEQLDLVASAAPLSRSLLVFGLLRANTAEARLMAIREYRSGPHQIFDSIVFRMGSFDSSFANLQGTPFPHLEKQRELFLRLQRHAREKMRPLLSDEEYGREDKIAAIKRRIAAVRAHCTMRKGKLGPILV